MFCYQCQEAAKNTGCTIKGVCGKTEETANLQDLLIFALKGLSVYGERANELGVSTGDNGLFVTKAIFTTITNANFDNFRLTALIQETLKRKESLKDAFLAAYREKNGQDFSEPLPDAATWYSADAANFQEKAKTVGVLATENEDVRSLRELLILGAVRGLESVDRERLADMLVTVGQIGIENENIKEIDINPVIISKGKPVAVDALVVLG